MLITTMFEYIVQGATQLPNFFFLHHRVCSLRQEAEVRKVEWWFYLLRHHKTKPSPQ